ncbi:MAG TPA: S24/S26 family peptidase [Mycobacteriales bacterium]|nr:S24/S26 family peptidase [Mycobacteriales bacterium]
MLVLRRTVTGLLLVLAAACAALALATDHSYVTTPSMYPTITPGSMVFVSPTRHYHPGQVIKFRANGLVWVHRLVEIWPTGEFITKGDNPQNARDVFLPALTRKDVVGVVTHAPRWLGFPELIAHDPAYGLGWLRAELGPRGKITLVGTIGLISFIPALDLPRLVSRRTAGLSDREGVAC